MLPLEMALFLPEQDGDGCTREEKQQVDAAGGDGIHPQCRCQPYHQQTAASHPQTGEKAQTGSDEQGNGKAIQDNAALPIQ